MVFYNTKGAILPLCQLVDCNNKQFISTLMQNKRAIKRTQDNPGGMVSVESPIAYSNVSLLDPVTKSPVKVSWRYLEDGTKVRVTRGKLSSGSVVPRPEVLKQRRKPRPATLGELDTAQKVVNEMRHTPGDLPTALKEFMEETRLGSAEEPVRFKYLRRALYMPPVPSQSKD